MVPGHTGRSMPGRPCEQTAPVGDHLQERSDLHEGVITPFQVSRRAAPAITAWCLDQSGAHGVELHVPRRGQEVVFIHDERGEAALPRVPSPALPEVDPPRVPPMCLADGATQALGGLRDNDQVNMIGHQVNMLTVTDFGGLDVGIPQAMRRSIDFAANSRGTGAG